MSTDASPERPRTQHDRLLKSTYVVATMTLLSRIAGLAREMVFATWFGSGVVMDAYAVAFKIPNLLRRFFAEGAFSQAFVPIISEYRTNKTQEEARELISQVSGTLGLMLFVVTAIGVIAAPVLIIVFAPGFLDGEDPRFGIATGMVRLTFPYLLFVSLTALAGSVLNSYRHFAIAAFTPVLLNIVMIVFAGWVEPRLGRPGIGVAAGVFVAGVVQLGFQLPFLAKLRLLPRPRWGWAHEGVRRIMKLMLPAIFGSSVAQISILFDTLLASFLAAGSISWLYYSDRLIEFPLGVFGVALATVILPRLSEHHATESKETFSATLDWALRLVLVLAVPAALGLVLLAQPLVATLLNFGKFTDRDVVMATFSVQAFAPGLIGFILVKVLAPAYFARQDTRTPVRIGVQALVLSMALNVVFVLLLVQTGWAPAHAGIAAATSCAAFFNSTFLLIGLLKAGVYRARPGWSALIAQVLAGNFVMAVALVWVLNEVGDWLAMGEIERAARLAVGVAGGALVYFAACYSFGLRPSALRMRAQAS